MSKVLRSILFCAGMGLALFGAASSAYAQLFNTVETTHEGLEPFPKWTGALERYFADDRNVPGECTEHGFNACHMQRWQALLDEVASDTRRVQLNKINRYMNEHRYIVDRINWGVEDYWAIPQQFLKRFGDCEDFAIAKYLSLRALGWPVDDMRIVVLQDMNLRVAHAILIVDFEGETLVLDNQITMVVTAEKIHHYRPIFSLNENGWWRHRSAASIPAPIPVTTPAPRRVIVVAENVVQDPVDQATPDEVAVEVLEASEMDAEPKPDPVPETIPETLPDTRPTPEVEPQPEPEKSWWQRFWDWLSGLFD